MKEKKKEVEKNRTKTERRNAKENKEKDTYARRFGQTKDLSGFVKTRFILYDEINQISCGYSV